MAHDKVVIEDLEGIYEHEFAKRNGRVLIMYITISGNEKFTEFAIRTSKTDEELFRTEDLQEALDVLNG